MNILDNAYTEAANGNQDYISAKSAKAILRKKLLELKNLDDNHGLEVANAIACSLMANRGSTGFTNKI